MNMSHLSEIQRLYSTARPEERREVAAAIAAMIDGFRDILICTKEWARTKETGKLDVTPLCGAMTVLHRIGAAHGIAFPDGTEVEEVKNFVLAFGTEILKKREEDAV